MYSEVCKYKIEVKLSWTKTGTCKDHQTPIYSWIKVGVIRISLRNLVLHVKNILKSTLINFCGLIQSFIYMRLKFCTKKKLHKNFTKTVYITKIDYNVLLKIWGLKNNYI